MLIQIQSETLICTAEMLHVMRDVNGSNKRGNRIWFQLSAVTVSRSFGGSTVNPALDSEGRGISHTDCTDDAKYNVHYTCDGGSRDGSVVKHRLWNVSRGS